MPGESHGQRRLEGYGSEGHRESDMTEATEAHMHGSLVQSRNSRNIEKTGLDLIRAGELF